MRGPVVCSSPGGKLWLVLDATPARCLDLETGEVSAMTRSLASLLLWGWQVVEGAEHLTWAELEA